MSLLRGNVFMARSLTDGEMVNGKKHGYWNCPPSNPTSPGVSHRFEIEDITDYLGEEYCAVDGFTV